MDKNKKICLITGGVILGLMIGSAIAYYTYCEVEQKKCPLKKLKSLGCCR